MSNFGIFLMIPGHQIWPCHVTQEANFEKFYFFLILHLILGKSAKFLVEKLSTLEVISQKPHGGVGGKHPHPVLLGLRVEFCLSTSNSFTEKKWSYTGRNPKETPYFHHTVTYFS